MITKSRLDYKTIKKGNDARVIGSRKIILGFTYS